MPPVRQFCEPNLLVQDTTRSQTAKAQRAVVEGESLMRVSTSIVRGLTLQDVFRVTS